MINFYQQKPYICAYHAKACNRAIDNYSDRLFKRQKKRGTTDLATSLYRIWVITL
jgi:hypothetical protein